MNRFTDEDIEAILEMLSPCRQTCAALECSKPATVVDETGRVSSNAIPLCDEHWEDWCEWLESEAAVLGGLTAHPANWW